MEISRNTQYLGNPLEIHIAKQSSLGLGSSCVCLDWLPGRRQVLVAREGTSSGGSGAHKPVLLERPSQRHCGRWTL